MARTKTEHKQKPAALAVDSQKQAGVLIPKSDDKPVQKQRSDIKGTGQNWRLGKTKYTADELTEEFVAYFNYCLSQEPKRKINLQGFATYIGVWSGTIKEWFKDNTELSNVIKRAFDCISDELQQRVDPMAIISMKQEIYGGFIDRPDMGSGGQVSINIAFGHSDDKVVAEYGK